MESTKPKDTGKDQSSRDAEQQIAILKTEVDSLCRQVSDRDTRIAAAEDLRLNLEKQLTSRMAETSKTAATSKELAELNFRLSMAELEAKEASESLAKYREQETEHADRLQQLQAEHDAAVSEQQKAAASLTSCKADLEMQIDKLQSQLESAEKTEKAKLEAEECKLELDEKRQLVDTVSAKLKDAESELNSATSEKRSLQLSVDRAQSELTEKKRFTESLQLQVDQLKELCTELESQIQDTEKLVECKELKFHNLATKHEEMQAAMTSNKTELSRVIKETACKYQ